ncbi:hypothetical protein L4D76_18575 [Photobacterium sagamiensis]|uniref:hypothetical protein n=1 Tax=Photobacterium sagamiensis TaxID=2910241 RepID=UPI003D13408D
MRKKVMVAFYAIASGLVLINIGLQYRVVNTMQSKQSPRYVFTLESKTPDDEKDDKQREDFKQWAEEFSKEQRIGG